MDDAARAEAGAILAARDRRGTPLTDAELDRLVELAPDLLAEVLARASVRCERCRCTARLREVRSSGWIGQVRAGSLVALICGGCQTVTESAAAIANGPAIDSPSDEPIFITLTVES